MSIQTQVSKFIKKNPHASIKATLREFDNLNPKTIRSAYSRVHLTAESSAEIEYTDASTGKINMEMTEALLMAKLKRNPDTATLRLIMDFLKIKQQDHSELEEIDLSIFYKKAMED